MFGFRQAGFYPATAFGDHCGRIEKGVENRQAAVRRPSLR